MLGCFEDWRGIGRTGRIGRIGRSGRLGGEDPRVPTELPATKQPKNTITQQSQKMNFPPTKIKQKSIKIIRKWSQGDPKWSQN